MIFLGVDLSSNPWFCDPARQLIAGEMNELGQRLAAVFRQRGGVLGEPLGIEDVGIELVRDPIFEFSMTFVLGSWTKVRTVLVTIKPLPNKRYQTISNLLTILVIAG